MMIVLDSRPFKADELPRVFWNIDAKCFVDGGVQPEQVAAFGAEVQLPNGWTAKCERVSYLGHDADQYKFMGFVTAMWDGLAKRSAAPEGGGRK